jgi:oxygen-dependent protoporphyrinogen oxidase
VAEPVIPRGPIVVIGGGVSGLTVARRLLHRSDPSRSRPPRHDVLVLEAKDRVGGAIWTGRQDGFTLEGGADSFITNKPWSLDLCRELGIGSRLIETDARHRRSFVVSRGRLAPVPDGFVMLAPTRLLPVLTSSILSPRGKLRMLCDLVLPKRSDDEDESLAAFVRRRFGREALERLVQPLVGGIYTADANELSLKATLPQFLRVEKESGSLIRAALRQARGVKRDERAASGARYGLFVSLDEGMDVLPRTLAESLPAGSIRTGAPVRRLHRPEGNPTWRIEMLDGSVIEATAVVLATEAHVAARLLEGHAPALAAGLRSIPYASSCIVHLAYRRDAVVHPLDGFGVVVPAIEKREILAISFTSIKFSGRAPAGTVLMRVFLGGATQPELFERDDEELLAIARREVSSLLGAHGEPILSRVDRHPRAMPQYLIGHLDRVAQIRAEVSRHSGLFLTGNAFEGVGLPDCVRAAGATADEVAVYVRRAGRIAAA